MDILFLSHCVPNPPDKGERIRSHFEVMRLAKEHRVHVCCFAKSAAEVAAAEALKPHCASVYAHQISPLAAPAALLRFALGGCLDTAYYDSSQLRRHVRQLAREVRLSAAVAFCTVMAPFAPDGVPLIFDQVDVDSEKWLQYASFRRPGFFYALEGRRMRKVEIEYGRRARCVFLSTDQEVELYRGLAPGAACRTMENGVDFDYFAPQPPPAGSGKALVFVGVMDYFPNADGACWFAASVFPELRRAIPELEFWIVGRNPSPAVKRLASLPGVQVTGAVPDVRPYVAAARAAVVPLRISRGIQNKVLEALAMDRPVLLSEATARTFGAHPPFGATRCATVDDYLQALLSPPHREPGAIRQATLARYTWNAALEPLVAEIDSIGAGMALPR
jgi:sugar transferase (PEP-CTERM/EpsH1 system associated)